MIPNDAATWAATRTSDLATGVIRTAGVVAATEADTIWAAIRTDVGDATETTTYGAAMDATWAALYDLLELPL